MFKTLSSTLMGTLVLLTGSTLAYAQKTPEGSNAAPTKQVSRNLAAHADQTQVRKVKTAQDAIEALGFKRAGSPPGPAVTHCRIMTNELGLNEVKWVRQAAQQDEFLSPPRYDFEILKSSHWRATKVSIDLDDIIYNTPAGARIKLEHRRPHQPPTIPVTFDPVASSSNMLQRQGGIWLQGDSVSADGSEQGTYYVFLLEDANPCTHTTYTAPCRRVHVEYFKNGLMTDRPTLGVNVFDIHDDRCTEGVWQTDDGDGDEGLR